MLIALDDETRERLIKYSERGWKNWVVPEAERPRGSKVSRSLQPKSQLNNFRRVGDAATWILNLDIEGVEPSSTPDSVVEHACFSTVKTDYRIGSGRVHVYNKVNVQPGPSFEVSCDPFSTMALQYTYTYAFASNRANFWHDIIGKLKNLTKVEIEKMDEEDRPAWFTAFFANPAKGHVHPPYSHHIDTLDKPSTWTYYDHLVPKWYEDWEAEKRERANEVSFRPASELPT